LRSALLDPRIRTEDPVFASYLALCQKYMLRQLLVYQHWPQRKFDALGYTRERIFADQNA
jgi:hypothetical protein